MHTLILNTKLAIYARQSYLSDMTRGLAIILLADVVVTLMLKRVERSRRKLALQLVDTTNDAIDQIKNVIN